MSRRDDSSRSSQDDFAPRRGHQMVRGSGAPSQRMLRVAETVRHAVSELFSRGAIQDDVIERHVITVPEVRMSPDLKLATVYVMPLGGGDIAPVLAALERNKRYIRGVVARAVNLKFAPDLRFRRDETFDEADRMRKLLTSPEVIRDVADGAGPADDQKT